VKAQRILLFVTLCALARSVSGEELTNVVKTSRFIMAAAVAWGITFVTFASSAVEAAPQPNIVHILTGDLGWMDVACYYRAVHGKESIYETPNMDRIANSGMRFMQAYSPSATCAPSRVPTA